MKIKWWGHASFLLTSSDGTTLLTDPYNEEVPYAKITDKADIVTVSHEHFDHNAVDLLPGNPEVIKDIKEQKIKNIEIRGISSFHDTEKGAKRGENRVFVFEIDGIKVCHLGDLGHTLDNELLNQIGSIDVLLTPVGGYFTIDAKDAYYITEQLNPSIVFPMHYKTEIIDFPISGVEEFLNYFNADQIKKVSNWEVEIAKLPDSTEVYVLDYVK